jgi:hypothetical protein
MIDAQPAGNQITNSAFPAINWTGATVHIKGIRSYIWPSRTRLARTAPRVAAPRRPSASRASACDAGHTPGPQEQAK